MAEWRVAVVWMCVCHIVCCDLCVMLMLLIKLF